MTPKKEPGKKVVKTSIVSPSTRPIEMDSSQSERRLIRRLLASSEEEDEYIPTKTDEKSDESLNMEIESSDDEPISCMVF